MIDKSKLKELALAATSGPWHVTKYCSVMDEGMDTLVVSSDSSHEDLAYIAAANPAAILELLAELESARSEGAKAWLLWTANGSHIEINTNVPTVEVLAGDSGWCCAELPGTFIAEQISAITMALAKACVARSLATTTSTEPAQAQAEASASPVPRAQGGNTRDEIGGSSPADAGGLTPYKSIVGEKCYRAVEVDALLATKAAQPDTAPSPKQEPSGGYDVRAEQAYFDRWPDIATSASASPAAPTEAEIRAAALEEAAKMCDKRAIWNGAEADEKDNTERNRATFGAWRDESEGCARAIRALAAAAPAVPVPAEQPKLSADALQWVVNDNAELGVKIGNQFFFLYKGDSLVYESGKHDDDTPMMWRPVGKCEFGECCHPVKFYKEGASLPKRYTDELTYIPGLSFGRPGDCDWQPLPAAPSLQQPKTGSQP